MKSALLIRRSSLRDKKMKMQKIINKYLVLSISLVLCLGLTSCGDDDTPVDDAQLVALRMLAGDWTLGNDAGYIRVDGVDVSSNYDGFSLFYATGVYVTQNGADLFRARGVWEWVDKEATALRLDDGKEINITQLTDRRFTFTFNLPSLSARAGIPGNYEISVVR